MGGFYGLDLYNLSGSMRAVIDFLERRIPRPRRSRTDATAASSRGPTIRRATAAWRCSKAMRAARCRRRADAEGPHRKRISIACRQECDEWLDAAANARLVKNAEAYYRVMYQGAAESWNLRDTHMFETLNQLLDAKGPDSRRSSGRTTATSATPRITDMGQAARRAEYRPAGCKEKFDAKARLIGFGTHTRHGRGRRRLGRADEDQARSSRRCTESYERMSHDSGSPRFLLDLRDGGSGREFAKR